MPNLFKNIYYYILSFKIILFSTNIFILYFSLIAILNTLLQTSSYGSCASKKRKPDLQCRREKSSGVLQPGGKEEERKQDPVELQGDGLQEDQGQR